MRLPSRPNFPSKTQQQQKKLHSYKGKHHPLHSDGHPPCCSMRWYKQEFLWVISTYYKQMKSFKQTYQLQKRKDIFEKEAKQHPTKIGVIAEMHPRSKLSITRFFKFMANRDYTVGSIQETIKKELIRTKQIPNNETTAIFIFLQQKLLKSSDVLRDLENRRDAEDNFLYLLIAEAESF